jgi:hypothetical protein
MAGCSLAEWVIANQSRMEAALVAYEEGRAQE